MKLFLTYIIQHRNLFILNIYLIYIMRRIKMTLTNEVQVKNMKAYFERTINHFGTGAKIDAPKEYLGKKVIVIVTD